MKTCGYTLEVNLIPTARANGSRETRAAPNRAFCLVREPFVLLWQVLDSSQRRQSRRFHRATLRAAGPGFCF